MIIEIVCKKQGGTHIDVTNGKWWKTIEYHRQDCHCEITTNVWTVSSLQIPNSCSNCERIAGVHATVGLRYTIVLFSYCPRHYLMLISHSPFPHYGPDFSLVLFHRQIQRYTHNILLLYRYHGQEGMPALPRRDRRFEMTTFKGCERSITNWFKP